jgi:hypothetical protein
MLHHESGQQCPLCTEKLTQAHQLMVDWFNWAKLNYPELHISWSFRNEDEQSADFMTGRSNAQWPNSKHNNMVNGAPSALALDVFCLLPNGTASFDTTFYSELADKTDAANYAVSWGGSFLTLKDCDHFEVK